jgi:hypothetical protein
LRHSGTMISKATVLVCGMLFAVGLLVAKEKPKKPTTAAEAVVEKYQALISSGALLTPDGWTNANKLCAHPSSYPKDSEIVVTYPGIVGEWPKGEEKQLGYSEGVVVESKWGSEYGSIDPKLRYHSPEDGTTTSYIHHLIQVNGEWKIAGPMLIRYTTVDGAIAYVKMSAEQSTDPVVKKNAAKTAAILKRLKQPHGNACAC